ncbi:MAG: hypothetical protein JWN64_52 [Parcubacteria group bacterium]|nr:hypothetical protein [Parcubacteria group bacterium]
MDSISKLLKRVQKKHREQILETLRCLYDEKQRINLDIQKLKGSDYLRVRSGKYRILFHFLKNNQIEVDDIRKRSEDTYRDI